MKHFTTFFKSGVNKSKHLFILSCLALLFSTMLLAVAPTDDAHAFSGPNWGVQLKFHAGISNINGKSYSIYVSRLIVNGTNQNNVPVTWDSSWAYPNLPRWTYNVLFTNNWWWLFYKPLRLDFYLDGYGWRYCNVGGSTALIPWSSGRNYLTVFYQGSNYCTVSGIGI
jgi:hypothetical protein